MKAFEPLVVSKIGKYRKFSNYPDLKQEGLVGILMALNTYKPAKGSFVVWATEYIKTRISRSANAHSTIKYPMAEADKNMPKKEFELPIMPDLKPYQDNDVEITEYKHYIDEAIKTLPAIHQKVIGITFGLNEYKKKTINDLIEELDISTSQYVKLLKESKRKLKIYFVKNCIR